MVQFLGGPVWSLLLDSMILMGPSQLRIFYEYDKGITCKGKYFTLKIKRTKKITFALFLLTNNHSVLYQYTRKVNP